MRPRLVTHTALPSATRKSAKPGTLRVAMARTAIDVVANGAHDFTPPGRLGQAPNLRCQAPKIASIDGVRGGMVLTTRVTLR